VLGTVSSIRRYPVKSMAGETLDRAEFGARGLRGDRAWAVRNNAGELAGAKKLPKLMGLSARYASAPPEEGSGEAQIALPDGDSVSTSSPDCEKRISESIGHEVTLESLRPPSELDFYRNVGSLPEDVEGYLRDLFARTKEEPLPDLSVFPPEIFEFSTPPGTFFDAFPLLVMSEAGLAHLQSRASDSRFDVRRFRPNLVIGDTGGDAPIPEFGWSGRKLRVGSAVLSVGVECPRCVMTTHAFDDLPKDPTIMRTLVREAGGNLGVYANVETAGEITVGDTVEFLDS
jgi:hypothetical protein